jgi:hypothetical protein
MPRCSFSFGQLEELLATMHRIDPSRRVAFEGRLKHLQRWGFPTGKKPGKGRSIAYTIEHVFRAVLALELIQAGINPKFAVHVVQANWGAVLPTVYLNSFTGSERLVHGRGSEADWCWLIRPEALRGLTVEGEHEADQYEAIHPVLANDLLPQLTIDATEFGSGIGSHWRNLIINGGPLVRGVLTLIEVRFRWASREDLIDDLNSALKDRSERLLKAMEVLDTGIRESAKSVVAERKARGANKFPYCDLYPSLVEPARSILTDMPPYASDILVNEEGAIVEVSTDALNYLISKRLLRVEAEEFSFTPLALVAGEILRGYRK